MIKRMEEMEANNEIEFRKKEILEKCLLII